ncbi:NADP-dependent 3-hydroxy acid dehydrogenase YdfG [Palleronia aestuarii]|uniref:NADP-dependent 3-hydroxy acid dehydrogenase YdfG n=1 Tax=Palleronia aestuarii TaxID=568105 RepID=A0A2W7N7F7_9RHOB|nr:SDR family oxidoreductase [Palleronia aestuarii]PZX16315.1 NADP-dependent 3-hydroxy acid dehydrogenase YdfG [Palleronia aestuarii]
MSGDRARRALVTGANRGIGAALHAALRGRGVEVTGTARQAREEGWLALDVTDPTSVTACREAWGEPPLDLLVCNAGIYPDKGQSLAEGYPPEMWEAGFATNVTGVFLTIQAFLPALRQAGGKVAIISSQMGSSEIASGGSLIYRASKAAAINLGRNLARDLKSDGVAVAIYHPGWVRTDMGGASAALTPENSAAGLLERFDALDLATTGAFETWDGRPHPF